MVKYEYDVKSEIFKRTDNRGRGLAVNIAEAQRIANLIDLGCSTVEIESKISLANPKGTGTTIRSFIRNYCQGNIAMPKDAPAPSNIFDSMTEEFRIDELERRVTALEQSHTCNCGNKKSLFDKVKSWI